MNGRVMVVDDEADVRKVAGTVWNKPDIMGVPI